MDFLLACPSCGGALLAHESLCGSRIACPHCEKDIEVRRGQPITESLVDRFLSVPATGMPSGPLRRLRRLPCASRSPQFSLPPLQRQARISRAR